MFKNLASIVIKFKGTIDIIPLKKSNTNIVKSKTKTKNNKTNIYQNIIECDDKYIKRIIRNGGL